MRLLALTNLYPPQHLGGFGICIDRLIRGLEGLGYDAHVLTSDQSYLGPSGSNGRVHRDLELLGSYDKGISRLSDPAEEQRRRANNIQQLELLLETVQPMACLVGNLDLLGTELLQPLAHRGIATVQHVGFMAAPYPPQDFPRTPSYRMAFASGEVKRMLQAQGWPVASHPIVHPPLDPETAITNPNSPTEPAIPLHIGFSGLFMHSKGVHTLLEACVLLHQWKIPFRLELAGKAFSPDYQSQLQRYALEHKIGDYLRWPGFLEGEAMSAFYQRLDILVFPSLHPESFGMVVAEAMAQGVLPLSSGVGGAFEVITHGVNGLLCEPGDGQSVARALRWCHHHRTEMAVMARRGQRHALQRFSARQSASVLDSCFRQLQSNNTPAKATEVVTF